MPPQSMQLATDAESGIRKAVPLVEYTDGKLGRNKIILQNVLGLSTDLAQASTILANRASEIVDFASALHNCGREEAATRISAFIESLYPVSSSLQSRRSFHSGLGEMIANRISANRVTWILALNTIGLLGLAAILVAK